MHYLRLMILITLVGLSGCGGGGGGTDSTGDTDVTGSTGDTGDTGDSTLPDAPVLSSSLDTKSLTLSWSSVAGATHYRLMRNPDGASGYSQLGADLAGTATSVTVELSVHLTDWANLSYLVEACNANGCTASSAVNSLNAVAAIGYIKASNTGAIDAFGHSVALSDDGNTLAVGTYHEDSNATGIDGNQADNSAEQAGAVYVFIRTGGAWSQQAYIKASNTEALDYFGFDMALSADGNTLAVGAIYEDSSATGIDGNQADNSADASGAVYVYSRSAGTWSQQAYVKASNTEAYDHFGRGIALSADGNTLAVGAADEDSSATGIDGSQVDNSESNSGAVYVFSRTAGAWSQQAYIKASNTESPDRFGVELSLSADGNTLAVGASRENSSATGIGGDQADNSAGQSGAVYVFSRASVTWSQQAYIKASNTEANDEFGYKLALSADGNTLAVSAVEEGSSATGIGGDQTDNSAARAGAAYVFTRTSTTWNQQAYIKSSNTEVEDFFGFDIALSADGNTLAVGTSFEDSSATGIGGDQVDNSADQAGAIYVFRRSANSWRQQAYVKASNTEANDEFGRSIALSADGNTLAVGAWTEDSSATGIDGNQADNSAYASGAVYLY